MRESQGGFARKIRLGVIIGDEFCVWIWTLGLSLIV